MGSKVFRTENMGNAASRNAGMQVTFEIQIKNEIIESHKLHL